MHKTPIGSNYTYLHSYYLKNKEHILARSAARYNLKRDLIRSQQKVRHAHYKNSPHGRYSIAKQMGITRGHGWAITYEQYLTLMDRPCYYCGGLVEKFGTGLDRVDSSKGYLFSNVRPCCKRCNQAKSNLRESEFYNHIRTIATHLNLLGQP